MEAPEDKLGERVGVSRGSRGFCLTLSLTRPVDAVRGLYLLVASILKSLIINRKRKRRNKRGGGKTGSGKGEKY